MANLIKLKKGHDIKLVGEASSKIEDLNSSKTFAARPGDFKHKRFKVIVAEGQEVKAGTPLAYDKKNESLIITAPHSGEVASIVRGAKRKLEEIVILADGTNQFEDFGKSDPSSMSREEIFAKVQRSGAWYTLLQRPFNVVASPKRIPRDVFISGFDSSPLSVDLDLAVGQDFSAFQAGVNALAKMTEGKVYLSLEAGNAGPMSKTANAEINHFKGKHPAGNVGIQIHHLSPILKGDMVWTVKPQDVMVIGRLFTEGRYNTEKLVAVAGSEVNEPKHIKTYSGANIGALTSGNVSASDNRIISGGVLSGRRAQGEEHLGFYHDNLSVIPEGRDLELFGWLLPSYPRPDISPSFPWTYMKNKEFKVNTNLHGERRAFVMSGQYEKVLPMDIFPVHLVKSILYEDFDEMEALGLMEVAPEDFALCEFVCTSKIPVQQIIQNGLDLMYDDES